MIFRTITNESTGAIKSIGLFGKTIDELKKSLSSVKTNGLFNTFFNTSTIDETAITKYNSEIEKAIANNSTMAEKQQIMKFAMEGTNKATAQLIGSTKGAIVETDALTQAQKSSTLAARAGAVAFKALSIAGNMVAMLVVTKIVGIVTTVADNLIHKAERIKEAAKEAKQAADEITNSYSNLSSKVADIKQRYAELAQGVNQITGENKTNSTSFHSECTVQYGYNAAENGGRECTPKRMSATEPLNLAYAGHGSVHRV